MWQEKNNKLVCEFIFKDFVQAFAFMSEVAQVINIMDHHPEWSNMYNKVSISLCTHDAGDIITEKDQKLAEEIDNIYSRIQS